MLGWKEHRPLESVLPSKEAKAFAKQLEIHTCGELLEYYPRTYAQHGTNLVVGNAQEGDYVTIVGEVVRNTHYPEGRRPYTRVVVFNGAEDIVASFFNTLAPVVQLKAGTRVMMSGKIRFFQNTPQLAQPSYIVLRPEQSGSNDRFEGRTQAFGDLHRLTSYGDSDDIASMLQDMPWIPIYPGKSQFASWRVFGAMSEVLRAITIPEPLDHIPHGMVTMAEAFRGVHQPDERGPQPYLQRLKYNEALALALVMALRRADSDARIAPECRPNMGYQQELFDALPFDFTAGQQKVITEIASDLSSTTPMNRLLQGEVGSGKTVVSLAAMLQVVDSGKQCALLAPTEVLVTQHARTLKNLLLDIPVNVVTLTGAMSVPAKRQALLDIVSGEADIVVGTHALIQQGVEFFDLGLVVVDEQHRFGVEQRDTLRNRGKDGITPHVLVMTATPIPRTVAMTVFGDLSVSTLRQLPQGRRPVVSFVVQQGHTAWMNRMWNRIREELSLGHQGYIVCPRIEGSGGVLETFETLNAGQFSAYTLAVLHGRMPAEEKERIMRDFTAGYIDMLVATTVIEVGVDVPNATVMLVREAESFGVSQLHQLRGRIGRGREQSVCFFHTQQAKNTPSYQRLSEVAEVADGFTIAEIDLRYRHEGDVLGTAQSGVKRRLKLLSLVEDFEIIQQASVDARDLVARNRVLAEQLISDVELDEQVFLEKT